MLGFLKIEVGEMSHIYTEDDSTLGAETRTVRHRLASMSPFRNLEVSLTSFAELISR